MGLEDYLRILDWTGGKYEATGGGRSRESCARFWNVWGSATNPGWTV